MEKSVYWLFLDKSSRSQPRTDGKVLKEQNYVCNRKKDQLFLGVCSPGKS